MNERFIETAAVLAAKLTYDDRRMYGNDWMTAYRGFAQTTAHAFHMCRELMVLSAPAKTETLDIEKGPGQTVRMFGMYELTDGAHSFDIHVACSLESLIVHMHQLFDDEVLQCRSVPCFLQLLEEQAETFKSIQ